MTVAVNGESARNGGTRNYLRSLLAAAPPDAFVPLFRTDDGHGHQTHESELESLDAALPLVERLRWDARTLPNALRAVHPDVLLQPSNIRPFARIRVPTVQVLHNVAPLVRPVQSLARDRLVARLLVLRGLTRHALRRSRGVVFLSNIAVELAAANGFHGESAVIRPGLDTVAVNRAPRDRTVVVVAHLFRYKRVEDAVEGFAFSKLADDGYTLHLYGGLYDHRYTDEVRAAIASAPDPSSIVVHDTRPPAEVREAVRSATAVVQPSACENAPQIVYEALSEDTPIVASDIPAHRELLRTGLYPVADTHAIAALLRDAVDGKLVNEAARQLPTWKESAAAVADFCARCA
jgi:glycosyltransferase involved in cell wall biosynthesis